MDDSVSPQPPHSNPIPASSGIYKITCIANRKIYIGSAVNLRKRKHHHWRELRYNKHHNPILQSAWNKYGEQAFTFEVVELVLPLSLTAREQYWFNKLKPFYPKGFNIAPEAGSQLGIKFSPEAREKLSQSHIGQVAWNKGVKGQVAWNKGVKQTPEQIKKNSQARLRYYQNNPDAREQLKQYQVGREQSAEEIEKRRQSMLKYYQDNPDAGKEKGLKRRGYKHTPEAIEKMKGRKKSPETRVKMKQAAKMREARRAREKRV